MKTILSSAFWRLAFACLLLVGQAWGFIGPQPPTITTIGPQTIDEDTSTGPLSFTVGDFDTPVDDLIVTSTSGNTVLFPAGSMVLGGKGSARTITLTPAQNRFGTSLITVTVWDGTPGGRGTLSSSMEFNITVNSVNDAPTISAIGDVTLGPGQSSGPIPFAVDDVEQGPTDLGLSVDSSDPKLLPVENIRIDVPDLKLPDRTITVTPVSGATGSALVTLRVFDRQQASSVETFTVTVRDTPPSISQIKDQFINEDTDTGELPFEIGDQETPASDLKVSAESLNSILVSSQGIKLSGQGSQWIIVVIPNANQSGQAPIIVSVSDAVNVSTMRFTVNVAPVNDSPVAVADAVTIAEDSGGNAIAVLGNDSDPDGDGLTVTSASTLVGDVVVVQGTTLSYTPPGNFSGIVTINYAISDGRGGSAESTVSVTVTSVNDPPAISAIADVTINEDGSTGPLAFAVSDLETSAEQLQVTVDTTNADLFPAGSIVVAGGGGSRTVTATPRTDAFGVATIILTVSDGSAAASEPFNITVNPVNDGPTIGEIPDQVIDEDSSTALIPFAVGDVDTPLNQLSLTVTSDNGTLAPPASVVLNGTGANRTVRVTPVANQNGIANITVTVSDGLLSASDSFRLGVNAVNDPPTISDIPNQTIPEDGTTSPLSFTVSDVETPASQLQVTATVMDSTLVPPSGIVFGFQSGNRTITLTPVVDRSGSTIVTVTVSDGVATASDTFTLNVTSGNDAPTISDIPDQVIIAGASTATLPFLVSDPDTPVEQLQIAVTTDNATLIPVSAVLIGGSGANRTVKATPVPQQAGIANITIVVSDGALTAIDSFRVTVNPVPPTFLSEPVSTEVTVGTAVTFTADATGTPPLRYQWFFNGQPVAGATDSSYVIPSAQPGQAGNYQVQVSNGGGSASSRVAVLAVNEFDFGDAPDPYPTVLERDGARHKLLKGFFLGNLIDVEPDGKPTSDALGDDGGGTVPDDEDGVTFTSPLAVGQLSQIVVVASAGGRLDAWIDFNANGSWADPTDRIFTRQVLVTGPNALTFTVPTGVKPGQTYARFRLSREGVQNFDGAAPDGEVEDYRVTIGDAELDFGDAPDTYRTTLKNDGARHTLVKGFVLGRLADAEQDGQPSSDAKGDDNSPPGTAPDEDGVKFLTALTAGQEAKVEVTAADRGKLDAWVDFNRDGNFDNQSERIFSRLQLGATVNSLSFPVPLESKDGTTFARFRFSREGVETFFGPAPEGEVEDYQVTIASPLLDYGDAPDPTYPTLFRNNGARHVIVEGVFLGRLVDREVDGQPHPGSLGDDLASAATTAAALDDEDGVQFKSILSVGVVAQVEVVASTRGLLDAWVDFNRDGDWLDEGERIFSFRQLSQGTNNLTFTVPTFAKVGQTFTRFRFSLKGVETFTGQAPEGEVEDHAVDIGDQLFDFGDAPDGPYPTTLKNDGARHLMAQDFRLGFLNDGEVDGKSSADALGDDLSASLDDEDGVLFPAPLIAGLGTVIQVIGPPGGGFTTAVVPSGRLDAWIDYNRNGSWDDKEDRIATAYALFPGTNNLTLVVPMTALDGETFARFRLSRQGGLDYRGLGGEGEVEDYRVKVVRRQGCVPADCRGTNFWLTFPGNYAPDKDNPVKASLTVVGSAGTAVKVEIPGTSFSFANNIPATQVLLVNLPAFADLGNTNNAIEKKGIHVSSSSPVNVYGLNRVQYTTDGFLGLPVDVLGKDYMVQSYMNLQSGVPVLNGSQFAMVATEDETQVKITPTVSVAGHAAGVAFTVKLNRGETYQLRATNDAPADLTGTLISADKPLAVFGSHQCANINGKNIWFCDYLVEQLTSLDYWGTRFIAGQLATRTGDTFRILASADNTKVFVNGIPVATLNRGKYKELVLNGPVEILADRPVHVAQFANSADFENPDVVNSDPFMVTVPHVGTFQPGALIPTAPASASFGAHYLSIVAPSSAVASVQVNGVVVPAADFKTPVGSSFAVAQVKVNAGLHTVTAAPGVKIGVFAYGWSKYDSYAWPGCMFFGDVQPPVLTCPDDITVTLGPGGNLTAVGGITCAAVVPDLRDKVRGEDNCEMGRESFVQQIPAPGTVVGPGIHTIELRMVDAKGNVGSCIVLMRVIDPSPLQIECPKEVVLRCSSPSGAQGKWAVRAFSLCTQNVPVTSDPPQGTIFPVGTTQVTCTASNLLGQVVTCKFNVVVTCDQKPSTPAITLQQAANDLLVIDFELGGVLEYAPEATGPWTPVEDARAPFTVPIAGDKGFYRVRIP